MIHFTIANKIVFMLSNIEVNFIIFYFNKVLIFEENYFNKFFKRQRKSYIHILKSKLVCQIFINCSFKIEKNCDRAYLYKVGR